MRYDLFDKCVEFNEIMRQVVVYNSRVEFFFTRLVSGYCDKSAKEKVEKMIDVDTKVAQKSSCSIMLSISRVVSQLIARAAPPHIVRKAGKKFRKSCES